MSAKALLFQAAADDLTGAPLDISVLILGESGAGKELVAHALHRLSPRVTKPLVAIKCAALTELLECEMFGHRKGSITELVK